MGEGLIYLSVMMFFATSYTAAQKLASSHISPILAALISSVTAVVLLGLMAIGLRATNQPLVVSSKGILFGLLIGICAAGIEYFGVLGYSKGVPITVASSVTAIVSVVLVVLYGRFLFQEGVTTQRVLALVLAAAASYLAATSK